MRTTCNRLELPQSTSAGFTPSFGAADCIGACTKSSKQCDNRGHSGRKRIANRQREKGQEVNIDENNHECTGEEGQKSSTDGGIFSSKGLLLI
jgi:hypothetical protein